MTNYGGTMPTQQAPSFNNMYANPQPQMNNPNVAPINEGFNEPMAANDACGSSWSKW